MGTLATSRRAREDLLADLFSALKRERPVKITVDADDDGVVVAAGSRNTNRVWYAERITTSEESATYRLLRLIPDHTTRMRVRQQPPFGMERAREFSGCRLSVFEVELTPPLDPTTHVIGRLQEAHARQARGRPLYQTRVRSESQIRRQYAEWVPPRSDTADETA